MFFALHKLCHGSQGSLEMGRCNLGFTELLSGVDDRSTEEFWRALYEKKNKDLPNFQVVDLGRRTLS